jgi:hypothetical protein
MPAPVNDHTADTEEIKEAISTFQAAYTRAYKSKTKTHKTYTWDGIPAAWINGLEGLFGLANMDPQIQENGCSRPEWTDNGNGAKEHCMESAKFQSNVSYTNAVTLIFAKTGGTWKLVSKTTP